MSAWKVVVERSGRRTRSVSGERAEASRGEVAASRAVLPFTTPSQNTWAANVTNGCSFIYYLLYIIEGALTNCKSE